MLPELFLKKNPGARIRKIDRRAQDKLKHCRWQEGDQWNETPVGAMARVDQSQEEGRISNATNVAWEGTWRKIVGITRGTQRGLQTQQALKDVLCTSDEGEIIYSETTIGSKSGKQFTDVWIMDSGATWHMTPHRD